MDAQLQVSYLLVESEAMQDLVGRVTKKEIKSSSNVYAKNNVTKIGDAPKIVVKKKKKKELFSKAYKVQYEKQENFNHPKTSKEVVINIVKTRFLQRSLRNQS